MYIAGEMLVTGASGFIGRNLAAALRGIYGEERILTPTSRELNLLDLQAVENYFNNHDIQTVYHMAARHAGVGSGINQELLFLETNLMLNYNIVLVSRKHNVNKIITLGSSCTYSTQLPFAAKETDLWNQRSENTYGTCKQVLLEHLQTQKDMNWVYLIPPNLYGPGDHFGETGTHFIPATVQKFQKAKDEKKGSIVIWGDGKQTRDFLYLDDILKALIEALTTEKYDKQPINIATGKQVSILKITELIRKYMRLEDIEICCDTTKPAGLRTREIDNSLFISKNPEYRFVQIEEGIYKTIDWYFKNNS